VVTKPVATALGALTGAIPLVAMLRLLAGAFSPQLELVGFLAVVLALLPWIAYVAARARRAALSRRTALRLLLLDTAAVGLVWLFTVGPVLALALAFAGFVLIWVHDLPDRPRSGPSSYVRIDDLHREDPDPVRTD